LSKSDLKRGPILKFERFCWDSIKKQLNLGDILEILGNSPKIGTKLRNLRVLGGPTGSFGFSYS